MRRIFFFAPSVYMRVSPRAESLAGRQNRVVVALCAATWTASRPTVDAVGLCESSRAGRETAPVRYWLNASLLGASRARARPAAPRRRRRREHPTSVGVGAGEGVSVGASAATAAASGGRRSGGGERAEGRADMGRGTGGARRREDRMPHQAIAPGLRFSSMAARGGAAGDELA